ncbi:tyrosine-type recombinase/integrase [Streptosporangium canum]|uniref:tyrosine-type recombinase/integrase n=1 Tax=Streptosporangium canum TaxID=324952 RepID=UPI003796AAA4
MPPHRLRHSLFTWLKSQGIDDALVQSYSGHTSRASLEIHSKIALGPAQETYDGVIDHFPVKRTLTPAHLREYHRWRLVGRTLPTGRNTFALIVRERFLVWWS